MRRLQKAIGMSRNGNKCSRILNKRRIWGYSFYKVKIMIYSGWMRIRRRLKSRFISLIRLYPRTKKTPKNSTKNSKTKSRKQRQKSKIRTMSGRGVLNWIRIMRIGRSSNKIQSCTIKYFLTKTILIGSTTRCNGMTKIMIPGKSIFRKLRLW